MQKKGKSAKTALIGELIEVVEAKNPSLTGIRGKTIDETRNTIIIDTEDGAKTLIKDKITIKINGKTIHGEKLTGRTEERIKK